MNYNDYDDNRDFEENEGKTFDKTRIITNAITIAIAIVISGIVLMAFYVVLKPNFSSTVSTSVLTAEQVERLDEVAKEISNRYLYDYDQEKIVDGAIDGMVSALDDPYSYYEDEESYQESLNSGANGTYTGIGVHLTFDTENQAIKVLGIMPGSPAEEVGISSGDVILQVDDLYVNLDTYTDAVDVIKGEEGTSVHLVIYRNDELIEYDVTRQKITENNVSSEILDGDIGYIKVFSFDNGVYQQFRDEYVKLRAQNIKGLIIDLRNNPGGYVLDAIEMLDLFIPEANVLELVSKDGSKKQYKTYSSAQLNIPLAVVVNQNSASASEIFASAIKDFEKGVVVGTKTYGKGVVQTVVPITGHGALYLVSAQYFTPSGVVIQDNGIEPNIVVEVSDDIKNNQYIDRDKDLQLQAAIDYIIGQM